MINGVGIDKINSKSSFVCLEQSTSVSRNKPLHHSDVEKVVSGSHIAPVQLLGLVLDNLTNAGFVILEGERVRLHFVSPFTFRALQRSPHGPHRGFKSILGRRDMSILGLVYISPLDNGIRKKLINQH